MARRPDEPVPGGLLIAQVLWFLAGVLFLGFGGFLIYEHSDTASLNFGAVALALFFAVAGCACAVLGYRLFIGERSARANLTWLGVITALPAASAFRTLFPARCHRHVQRGLDVDAQQQSLLQDCLSQAGKNPPVAPATSPRKRSRTRGSVLNRTDPRVLDLCGLEVGEGLIQVFDEIRWILDAH
ncbi:hypothetical protein AAHB37_13230 [Glutamicibacter halophytocola]|uniref:hypothetical protein n=1 Tax=Glutamicibacter halophytocola TaxID=1933880 RepID=UPI00321B170D